MIIRLTFLVFALAFNSMAFSQSKEVKLEALNSTLSFANEGAHGLLIVHRLLENYNQDINKYVDLESFKINFYTNKDLPSDIFDDPDNWFYDTSPYEWHDIAIKQLQSSNISQKTNLIKTIKKMKGVLFSINQLRFDIDDAIIDKDLTDTTNLNIVYDQLERGVKLYADYYNYHQSLLTQVGEAFQPLIPNADEVQYPELHKAMLDVYLTTRRVLLAVRDKDDEQIEQLMRDQKEAISIFKKIDFKRFGSTRLTSSKATRYRKNLIEQLDLSIATIDKFYNTAEVPEEYKQYGRFYYYYNSDLINKYNRYGNGITFELNNIVKYLDMPVLFYTELPHYFKVIYPKKLEKVEHLSATDSKITKLPSKLKDREISTSTRKIKVDSLQFEVELYDHMIIDGDIISLNFNGDWIVEKMPLTAEKKKLKLALNEEGKNFFILHAENIGTRPPNTMAVDYYFQGKKQQIILKSDLNVSEMIEIEYIK